MGRTLILYLDFHPDPSPSPLADPARERDAREGRQAMLGHFTPMKNEALDHTSFQQSSR